jgi:cobaltochelatase CobS
VKVDNKASKEVFAKYLPDNIKDALVKATNGEHKDFTSFLEKMPLINLILLNAELVTIPQLKEVFDRGYVDLGCYGYPYETGKEFVDNCTIALKEIEEVRQSGATVTDLSKYSFEMPSLAKREQINKLLTSTTLPPIEDIIHLTKGSASQVQAAQEGENKAKGEVAKLQADLDNMRIQVQSLMDSATSSVSLEVEAVGELPDGVLVTKKASELFPDVAFAKDFEVPCFEWSGPHHNVPAVDPNYIFRPKELARLLYAIKTNQRSYLQGHTGSGKTTLVEQVCAHLNLPFFRVNFDSEITRADLIGRDTLKDGKSEFIDGMLPHALAQPGILCCDEIDFVRPDVAYVMQSVLEGGVLRITEDGDRLVKPHPMNRLVATGNTVGQGDEEGMYQGARPQSMAFLDRFTVWIKVDYLEEEDRIALVKKHYPTLTTDETDYLNQYVNEHMAAFTGGEIMKPITPRGMLNIAKATAFFGDAQEAIRMTVMDGCTSADCAAIEGILDRIGVA